MEVVHIHQVPVKYRNQVICFKIFLPRNVEEITGIYVTDNTAVAVNGVNGFGQKWTSLINNLQIGRLCLKQRGKPNTFFAQELIRNDNSLRYG